MAYSNGSTAAKCVIGKKWADWNEKGEGKPSAKQGNVSFEGERFYSYGTPVACYYEINGAKFVLITTHKYSITTSGHVRAAHCAANAPTFVVPTIVTPDHLTNVRQLWGEVGILGDEAIKNWNDDGYCGTWDNKYVEQAWHRTAEYVDLTGVKFQLTPLDVILAAIKADRDDKRHAYYHSTAVARRERAAAKRLALQVLTNS